MRKEATNLPQPVLGGIVNWTEMSLWDIMSAMSAKERDFSPGEITEEDKSALTSKVYQLMENPKLKDNYVASHRWTTGYKKRRDSILLEIPEPGHASKHKNQENKKECEEHTGKGHDRCFFSPRIQINFSRFLFTDANNHAFFDNQTFSYNLDKGQLSYRQTTLEEDPDGNVITRLVSSNVARRQQVRAEMELGLDVGTKEKFNHLMSFLNSLTSKDEIA